VKDADGVGVPDNDCVDEAAADDAALELGLADVDAD
jgi:hypothetical protein